jgi:hypothetical protein
MAVCVTELSTFDSTEGSFFIKFHTIIIPLGVAIYTFLATRTLGANFGNTRLFIHEVKRTVATLLTALEKEANAISNIRKCCLLRNSQDALIVCSTAFFYEKFHLLFFTGKLLEPHCGYPSYICKFKPTTINDIKAAAVGNSEVEVHFIGVLMFCVTTDKNLTQDVLYSPATLIFTHNPDDGRKFGRLSTVLLNTTSPQSILPTTLDI